MASVHIKDMRAQSVYDRDGNSYRYYRAVHKVKELEERKAQEQKWTDLYEKLAVKGQANHHKHLNNK